MQLCEVARGENLTETEGRVAAAGTGGRKRRGGYCLMGTDFLFCKVKSSMDGWQQGLHNSL